MCIKGILTIADIWKHSVRLVLISIFEPPATPLMFLCTTIIFDAGLHRIDTLEIHTSPIKTNKNLWHGTFKTHQYCRAWASALNCSVDSVTASEPGDKCWRTLPTKIANTRRFVSHINKKVLVDANCTKDQPKEIYEADKI